jgi:WD40 repeat protein
MRKTTKLLLALVVLGATLTERSLAGTKYIITNDDNPSGNSATIFSEADDGTLSLAATIPTGGYGLGGGYFASSRVNVLRSKVNNCVYVADAFGGNASLPSDVAAIDMATLTLAGRFPGFPLDSGASLGISLAEDPNGTFLFAAFSQSGTITTYKQGPGCQLERLNQIITFGARNFPIGGMKVTPNGNFLIVSYEDGSIGSYKINNVDGDLFLIHRYLTGDSAFVSAASVEITSDSQWVLFGDVDPYNSVPTVDIAPIRENGTLGPTQDYAGIGSGLGSANIWLSPGGTVLYISNTASGQITAVPFDKQRGAIEAPKACTSPVLNGFGLLWSSLGTIVGTSHTGTGTPLFAAEYGSNEAGIAVVDFTKPCMLTEVPNSPAVDPASSFLLSIGADPPRSF